MHSKSDSMTSFNDAALEVSKALSNLGPQLIRRQMFRDFSFRKVRSFYHGSQQGHVSPKWSIAGNITLYGKWAM